ncbi:MAG TPA: N-acetylglucosamine-6-phosphate deacetylase [Actinomycetaceae bacterium]|nr:N-acetylglucosamine-6-phosphate deacetylase [Actinomycetaceae bacterium]
MILRNARVHTGDAVLDAGEVIVDGGRVAAVGHPADGPRTNSADVGDAGDVVDLEGAILAPGFVDLMVNGGGGVLFNESPERIDEIARAHRTLGTTSFLPNFITDSAERMEFARGVIEERAGSDVLGIHFEGPVLSPKRPGMHAVRHLAGEFPFELARRTDDVVTVVTVAPEVAGECLMRSLVAAGARVAMGHSDATLAEFRAGVAAGGSLVTHMFNGMRPFAGRDPGIVGGGLTDDDVWIDIINDGIHSDFASVRLAWLAKPAGKCFFVTDAMPPVGFGVTEFTAVGVHVTVRDGRLRTDAGALGGSLLDMATAVRNGVEHVGIPLEEALRMASTYPARYLGVDDRIGRVAPGCAANLVVLDDHLQVRRVMFEGEWVA